MPRINKSGRVRGAIWNHIRKVGARKEQFSPIDVLGGPIKSYEQARSNCMQMYREGELERLVKGVALCSHSIKPVYRLRE